MSFYFREKPRFGDKLRGKPRDEFLNEFKQQLDDSGKSFFEPASTRLGRDPFERHTGFSRGFPFDDAEGFGRRSSDIRSHLDDLASRHPEFADHLLGPPWGDIPSFHTGSLRNRRRGSGGSSSHHGHPDDDARSQASGSSGASAASGASGVSSRGEKSTPAPSNQRSENSSGSHPDSSNVRRNPIPQYGLRNTVDIGQHRHNMENPSKNDRGQRSMSAPPENRQQDDDPNVENSTGQQTQNPNQRYVSRVDITPQFVQPQSSNEKIKPQQPQKCQQQPQQQQPSNVRHIPIFVEGRDEPVIPKNVDQTDHDTPSSWSYGKPQSHGPWTRDFQQPSQFSSPPKFHRPSHFNKHMSNDPFTNFGEEFYSPQSSFQSSTVPRKPQQHQQFPSRTSPPGSRSSHFRQHPDVDARRQWERPFHGKDGHDDHEQPSQRQTSESPKPRECSAEPRKQTQPKGPLEKVAEVQKEVDALTEQVNMWNGTSRKDKNYMYLDEMLTRELIKLDDIETEGKENVRQARKNAIRSIQDSISLLESKAPLPGQSEQPQQQQQQQQATDQPESPAVVANSEIPESAGSDVKKMDDERETSEQQPIPLPAGPSSPVKDSTSGMNVAAEEIRTTENRNADVDGRPSGTSHDDRVPEATMNAEPVENVASSGSTVDFRAVEKMDETRPAETITTETPFRNDNAMTTTTTTTTFTDTDNPTKSPKVAKKVKKTRKQPDGERTNVGDCAIALPAPENTAK